MYTVAAKFNFEATEVEIRDYHAPIDLNLRMQFAKYLWNAIPRIKWAKGFKRLEIWIMNSNHNTLAGAKYRGDNIGLVVYFIEKFIKKGKIEFGELIRTTIHELRHLYDLRKNEYHRYREAFSKSDKFKDLIAKHVKLIDSRTKHRVNYGELWGEMRQVLFLFLHRVILEGLAEFAEGNLLFDERTFNQLHQNAVALAKKLKLQLLSDVFAATYKEGKYIYRLIGEFKKFYSMNYNKFTYPIGCHVIYTLIYVFNIRLADLRNIPPARLIKLYISACARKGIEPVIGFTTQDSGIFNYGKILQAMYLRKKK